MHARQADDRLADHGREPSSLATSLLFPAKEIRDAEGEQHGLPKDSRDNSRITVMRYLHTIVRVSDLDASLDFYCNMLGLVEVRRMENEKGRFTLVFLATPDDAKRIAAQADTALAAESPVVELTYNWDEKGYAGGRNFGHLAYRVGDIDRKSTR